MSRGLGDVYKRQIYRGITTYNMALTFGGSLLIALLALISDLLLGRLEKNMKKRSRI